MVLESVGGPIVDAALKALAHGGRLVAYGQASGASNMVSLDDLMDHSVGVIGYWALPHMRDLAGTRRTIEGLLRHVASGRLRAIVGPCSRSATAPRPIPAWPRERQSARSRWSSTRRRGLPGRTEPLRGSTLVLRVTAFRVARRVAGNGIPDGSCRWTDAR